MDSRVKPGLRLMKVLIFCMLASLPSDRTPSEVKTKEECKCWEDFYPEKGEFGTWYCRGGKHLRIFGCNEEKPPICQCLVDGRIVEVDLGELNCLGVNAGRWCHNREEMEEYFCRHPHRRIYD
ncbi:hypothetical protein Zmor_002697 [Zophobas morio]|uniref:Uncharacterized protein n=1 Tax=Zophobas morio TaxID=2755281 RepID=A0AA38HKE0_9CUCU|nr:hypothetical protein Zmor_002697 [Zophobas morio]